MNQLNNIRRYRKKIVIALVAVALVVVTGVLVYKSQTFPAEECVETIISVLYTGRCEPDREFQYMTEQNEEEAQKLHKQAIECQKETLKQYFGITELTEEGEERLEEFVRYLYGQCLRYEITDVEKKDKDYIVTTKVEPLAFYKILDEEKIEEGFRKKAEDGEYSALADAEYQTAFLEFLLEQYESVLRLGKSEDGKTDYYTEKEQYTLTLQQDGNVYVPSGQDFLKLDQAFIRFSK